MSAATAAFSYTVTSRQLCAYRTQMCQACFALPILKHATTQMAPNRSLCHVNRFDCGRHLLLASLPLNVNLFLRHGQPESAMVSDTLAFNKCGEDNRNRLTVVGGFSSAPISCTHRVCLSTRSQVTNRELQPRLLRNLVLGNFY